SCPRRSGSLKAMLDLKLVRDDPEGVKAALAKRGPGAAELVERLLEADAVRRRLVTEGDALRAEQKRRGNDGAKGEGPRGRGRRHGGGGRGPWPASRACPPAWTRPSPACAPPRPTCPSSRPASPTSPT